jgi:hypothetical protein
MYSGRFALDCFEVGSVLMIRNRLNKMLPRCFTFVALAIISSGVEAPVKVTKKYPVPGNSGGFDYIVFDSSSNRLYLSHGMEVDVLDANSGKVLGGSGVSSLG